MIKWCVLLRGINVGGKNLLPMQLLTQGLREMGCADVKSYIQSGNLVLSHPAKDASIISILVAEHVKQVFDFLVEVLVLDCEQFSQAIDNNPFSQQECKSTHWFFLKEKANDVDFAMLESLKKPTESYQLIDNVFYLYAPEGIGRSKLVAKAEKCLGVPVTARNGNTVHKLLAMLQSD